MITGINCVGNENQLNDCGSVTTAGKGDVCEGDVSVICEGEKMMHIYKIDLYFYSFISLLKKQQNNFLFSPLIMLFVWLVMAYLSLRVVWRYSSMVHGGGSMMINGKMLMQA